MKSMFEVTDKHGRHLCFLVATSERRAIDQARADGLITATGATWLKEA